MIHASTTIRAAAIGGALACAATICMAADEPEVTATLSQQAVRVGDRVELTVQVTAPDLSQISVEDPAADRKAGKDGKEDTESTWSLLSKSAGPDEAAGAGTMRRTIRYTLAPFRTGNIPAPEVAVSYQPTSGPLVRRVLAAGEVEVRSVLPPDAAKEDLQPKDIKGALAIPAPRWLSPLIAVAVGLVALALVWFLWSRLRRRVQRIISPPQRIDEWALSELSAIEAANLPEHKKVKEHYTRVADVVRRYLGGVFGFDAMDLTTHEALQLLEEVPGSAAVRSPARGLLEEADLVKFAKYQPEMPACRRMLDGARSLVEAARPALAAAQETDKGAVPGAAAGGAR